MPLADQVNPLHRLDRRQPEVVAAAGTVQLAGAGQYATVLASQRVRASPASRTQSDGRLLHAARGKGCRRGDEQGCLRSARSVTG